MVGEDITTRTIPAISISDDIDNKDVNDVSTPPVGVLPQPIVRTIVDIDQSVGDARQGYLQQADLSEV